MTSLPPEGAPAGMSLSRRLRLLVKACANIHRPGPLPDIFLFATPRSGSTWLMEIIASQPGFKYYDEPLNPRRENVTYGGLFPDYASLMPETGNADRIIAYLRELQAGRHRHMNPPPFRRNHRFFTNRIVFKIHEIEHLIDRVARECSGQMVYLLRHPIANSISRTVQPRLDLFLDSPYYCKLAGDAARIREIRSLAVTAPPLRRAVISWCFENLIIFRTPGAGRLLVTYEELVLNPLKSCDFLMRRLNLPDRDSMLASFERPAINIRMSRAETIEAMNSPDAGKKRARLVSKWKQIVTPQQCSEVAQILDIFEIDAYVSSDVLASRRYLQFSDTPDLLVDS